MQSTFRTPLEYWLACIILIVTLILSACIAVRGVHIIEREECLEWQQATQLIPHLQYQPWQFAQCDHYNISI